AARIRKCSPASPQSCRTQIDRRHAYPRDRVRPLATLSVAFCFVTPTQLGGLRRPFGARAFRHLSGGFASLHPRLYPLAPPALSNQDVVRPAARPKYRPKSMFRYHPAHSRPGHQNPGMHAVRRGVFEPRCCQAGGGPEAQAKVDVPLPSRIAAPEHHNPGMHVVRASPTGAPGVTPGVERTGTPDRRPPLPLPNPRGLRRPFGARAFRHLSGGFASLHPRLYSVAPPALSNQDVVRPDFHAAVGRDALPNRAVSVAPWGSSCRNASGGFRFAVLPVLLPRASGAFVPRRCQAGGAPEVQGKVDLPLPSCTVSTGAPESWNARGTCKPQRGAGVKPGVKRS